MTSFWNEIEKFDFDKANSGQITNRTEEGCAIINILQNSGDIKNIVEIGTWNGLGSTLCILHGIQNKDVRFWSLECNREKIISAIESLGDYIDDNVQLLWGSVIDIDTIRSKEYLSNFKELETSEILQKWFNADLNNCEECPNILKQLPDTIDFLLLDGGEFTTYYEFQILKNRCTTHDNKNVFYIDDDHLSLKGSELVIKEMSKNINFFNENIFSIQYLTLKGLKNSLVLL
jgi:hypothetical protein